MDHKNLSHPRHVVCSSQDSSYGNVKEYTWDKQFIFVSDSMADDTLMLQNVFEGNIISSDIHPLVFDSKSSSSKGISFRSLDFYREVDHNNTLYQSLSTEEKTYFLIGVRDLFLASCNKMLSAQETDLLKRIVQIIDPYDDDQDIVAKQILNMKVTPYPTRSNKAVKFIEQDHISGNKSGALNGCFAKNEAGLMMVFIDPYDLSYENLNNITNLDFFFGQRSPSFIISNTKKISDTTVATFTMTGCSILMSLDKLNLYHQSINKLSQKNQHFRFCSSILNESLTLCIKEYMQETIHTTKGRFRSIDYVFSFGKFRSSDQEFLYPYSQAHCIKSQENSSSRVFLLLCVSSSTNAKIESNASDVSEQIKGIIFHQKDEDKTKSLLSNQGIVLCCELVYEDADSKHEDHRAAFEQLDRVCYLEKRSPFYSELQKYESDIFQQAAKTRLRFAKHLQINSFFTFKKYNGIPFVTNGCDYWFQSSRDLRNVSVVAVLDFLNCRQPSSQFFRRITYQSKTDIGIGSIEEIYTYLYNDVDKTRTSKKEEKLNSNHTPKDQVSQRIVNEEEHQLQFSILGKKYEANKDQITFIHNRIRIGGQAVSHIKEEETVCDECLYYDQGYIGTFPGMGVCGSCFSVMNGGPSIPTITTTREDVLEFKDLPVIPYKTSEFVHHLKLDTF